MVCLKTSPTGRQLDTSWNNLFNKETQNLFADGFSQRNAPYKALMCEKVKPWSKGRIIAARPYPGF